MLSLTHLEPRGLAPVDLALDDGACLAISGPSGAGKTVLLRAIADLDRNGGDAETNSMIRSQVAAPVWRKAVTYVPAESGWWADQVDAHMPAGDPGPLLDSLNLDRACLAWQVSRLSTGERQRLALIRALLLDPNVLLLDEPTSALDDAATGAVERVLTQRMNGGTTVVIVTHDGEQAQRLGGTVAVVGKGCVELSTAGGGR
ncbi:MAG: ATP-binding cassette domain-containing protein [Alphaproteobacteria bacterium]|nr:ATP-binding cassette domain-containing protein [Alphaproteobacteria bacterium]